MLMISGIVPLAGASGGNSNRPYSTAPSSALNSNCFGARNPYSAMVFFAARQEVSGLEVPAPESDFFAVKDVPHGTVRTEWYRSKITGEFRRIFVYTPPG